MEENGLVKKELGFFQRIRKSFYLRGMDSKKAGKYYSLPDYLKQDEDVIDAVVSANENLINHVPIGNAKKILKQNPTLLHKFYNIKVLNQVFNEKPELIASFESEEELNNIFNLIYNDKLDGNREFIKYLSKDLQMRLLTEDIEYRDVISGNSYSSFEISSRDDTSRRGYFHNVSKYLGQFSEEVVLSLALQEDLRIQELKKKGSYYISENKVLKFDIPSLSVETQLKLLLISSDFDSKVSDETMLKFVNGNPLLFDRISDKLKQQMLTESPELLSKMPQRFQIEYLKYHSDAFKYSNVSWGFKVRNFENPDEAISRIVSMGGLNAQDKESITDIRNNEYIWKMGQFDPEIVELRFPSFSNDYGKHRRNEHLVRNFHEHVIKVTGESELTKYLEKLVSRDGYYGSNELYTPQGVEKVNRIVKMILNEDILRSVPGNIILDFAQNPSHEKLVEIVRTTYGDNSARILEDRPGMNIDLIPNLHLFKPEIVNEFGIGAIHANLSYNMDASSSVMSELARKPELMMQYRAFNEGTKEMFPDTAVGLQDKLTAFVKCKELIQNVDFKNLTEKQKENLQIALIDLDKKSEAELVEFPKTLEALENYTEKRNALYDEAIKKEKDLGKLKQLISRRYFGLDYNPDVHHIELNNPSVWGMCHFYNLGKFVNDPITLQGRKFSEEELDSLELLDIFTQIKKPEVLIELAEKLSKKEKVINPIAYKALQEKVPMQYNREMVDSLLTPEKAMKMVEDGVPGIEMREEDGVTVITLSGADFKLYVSNPFMDNSGIGSISREELARQWNEKENGISTFSGCVIDQAEMTSCVSKGDYGLGFSNISPYQIVGMGITDIHTSHNRKQVSPYTTEGVAVTYDYPEEFMRRVARRLNYEDPYGDSMHKYDEMAALRVEKYLSKIKEGTFGGKILADYIFMHGTNTGSAVAQAKRCGIKYVFAYDEEKYRYVDRSRTYRNPEENPPRQETEFMSDIKTVVKGDGDDGR